jgi:hypothetical protein
MTTETPGVDFSEARPAPSLLTRSGFRFVMGYVSHNPAKNLTAQNVRDYIAAGLSVGLVWEDSAGAALLGAAAGARDGAAADAQADSIGYPVDSPIFFAVDQSVSLSQINGPIRAYAVAFDAAMKRPAGVYGSFLVVNTLVTPGQRPMRYGWQTAGWSAGALSTKAHIYQRGTPSGHWPVISGTDENVLCIPLPLAGPMHPKPAPPPAPKPPKPPTPTPVPTPDPPSPPAIDVLQEIAAMDPATYAKLVDDIANAAAQKVWAGSYFTEKGAQVKEGQALKTLFESVQAIKTHLGA